MGLLGDFLESFYSSGRSFQSVQAHVRRETMPNARGETSRRRAIGRAKTPIAKSKIATVNMKLWAVLPEHVRVDETRIKDGEAETTVEITRGNERLKQNADGSVEVENEKSRARRAGNNLTIVVISTEV